MNVVECRDYCLHFPGVEESFPFDESSLVFKVGGKMFILFDIEDFQAIAVKCDPELAIELREKFPSDVQPAYHFNKKHWNNCSIHGTLGDKFLKEQIKQSYELVRKSLPKKVQAELDGLGS